MLYDSICHMRRTTIFISEEAEGDLREFARRIKRPVAWVVREAVATYLASQAPPRRPPASIGSGSSGRVDVASRFEELLFADSAPAGASRRPAAPRTRGHKAKRRSR